MEDKYDYKNLDVYKESKILVKMVYVLLKQFINRCQPSLIGFLDFLQFLVV